MEEHNNENRNETTEPKKVGLAEAAKRMLEQKKQAQSQGAGGQKHIPGNSPKMKSQQTKKANNQKRRTGV